jgi:hypothetical protein
MKKILFMIASVLCFVSVVRAADVKVSAMPEATAATSDDLIMIVDDPGGTPVSKKITVGNFAASPTIKSDGKITIEAVNGKTITVSSGYYIATGTSNFVVPTPTSTGGNQYFFKQTNNGTNVITVIPVHTSGVMLEKTDGTGYCSPDDKLVSGGGKTDRLGIVALDATHYEVFTYTGTWTCTAH